MGLVAERESGKFEGASPLGKSPLVPLCERGSERDFNKERGTQGVRLIKKHKAADEIHRTDN